MGIVIRQSIKGTIVTYIGALIGFINTLFIFTDFLSPEEIGLQRIIIEAGILLATLAQLGTPNLGIRFFPYFKSEDGKNNGLLLYLMTYPLLGILVFFTVFLIFKTPISSYFSENSEAFVNYYYCIFPFAVFYIYQSVFATYANALMRIVVPRITQEIFIRLALLAGVLLYHYGVLSLDGWMLSILLSYMLAMLINFFYLFKIGKISLKRTKGFVTPKLRNEMLRYMIYLLAISLVSILSAKVGIFMVSAKIGLAFTAVYSIAYYMAAIIEMPARSIGAIVAPIVSTAIKENDIKALQSNFQRVSINQFLVGCLLFLFLWINVDNIFAIIPNGNFYEQGKFVVLFIGITKIIESALSMSGIIISYSHYYRYSLLFTFIYAVMIIFCNNWLIPILNVTGAALATLIVAFVFNFFYTFFVWYKSKVYPFQWGHLSILGLLLLGMGVNEIIPEMLNIYIDALLRTLLIVGGIFAIIYFAKISKEANTIVNEGCKRVLKFVKPSKTFVIAGLLSIAGVAGSGIAKAQKINVVDDLDTKMLNRILIIYDASNSMNARWQSASKMSVTKSLLMEMLDSLQNVPRLQLGLRIYGHQSQYPPLDCGDTKLEVPFSPDNTNNIKKIIHRIKTLVPKGASPIAYSLEQAAEDFPPCQNCRNIIILITDGIEECNGDPCAASLYLQKHGISLKPFIIGVGNDFSESFDCVGEYFDASKEQDFITAFNVVISQALNSTTAQVNLLDKSGNPTETNINMTFYDHVSGQVAYNYVHTLNFRGMSDTVTLDPLRVYDLEVQTVPPVRKDSVVVKTGQHNIIGVDASRGQLQIKMTGSRANFTRQQIPCIVRCADSNKILNVQSINETEKYLTGFYDVEILSLPRIVLPKVSIDEHKTTTVEIPMPGILVFQRVGEGFGTLYSVKNDGKMELVYTFEENLKTETLYLQPGRYKVVNRSKYNMRSSATREKDFSLEPGQTVTVNM